MAENKIAYLPEGGGDYRDGWPTYRDYMFLASRIKMRANAMLTFERLEQILASGNVEMAERLLAESNWPNMAGMSGKEIDKTLAERRAALLKEMTTVVPEDAVVEVFRLQYDYHNAKAIVKAEAMDLASESLMSDAGRVSGAKLKQAYEENDFRFVPSELGKAMVEAKNVLARTQNPQLADFVLDKAYFTEMKEMVETVEPGVEHYSPILDPEPGDPFMVDYCKLLIDCANLRTCVRCARMGKNAEFLQTVLIPDGGISADYMARTALSGDGLSNMFVASPLQEAANLGVKAMRSGSLTKFEKECDDAIMRWLANLRLMYFGPQLVVWYLTAEDRNTMNVRMILNGLIAGIAPERLKERLRDTYV